MTALLVTALAALVFVILLLRTVFQRRRRMESARVGTHRRESSEPPSASLQHAIATAGTHGLGMIRKSAST